jgi:hypothetical protein
MQPVTAGSYRLSIESVTAPFRYRVVAGPMTSPTYQVSLAHLPRVTRIDLEYTYPVALGLAPRTEQDGGDIYAPRGTDVRIRVQVDRAVAGGSLMLGRGTPLSLRTETPTTLFTTLKIEEDNSYRVSFADSEGKAGPGETEYFIRVIQDRPPEVHVTKPAGDRSVTRLQEVEIEAQADDDHGIDRLELVYSIRGGAEKIVPLDVPRHTVSVSARHMMYLEDLDVQPGDFVSYYVRARDRSRGARSNETRSDIFFLDVRPFEQEFSLAQSQSMAGSGYSGAIDELVNAQRQVVVATWKLERRAASAQGARSPQDVKAVARTEEDLRQRAERTASSFRESTMRDPRDRSSAAPSSGQLREDENAMAAAVQAMGRAVVSLDAMRTADALPPEMEALNHLLKAQAEIRHRQVATDQSAGAAGNANRNFDLSTLFDQELRRRQQTSYETPKGVEKKQDSVSDVLERIRDLARRQDELLRRQQELAQSLVSGDELKRQLEQLTREQSALRQRAEELTSQMSGRPSRGQPSNDPNAKMRDISEDMRQAAGDLRRGASGAAGSSAGRALEKLRDLERRLQQSGPDERRRALGEIRLEARQLADRQRQVAGRLAELGSSATAKDSMRQLAGDQERLFERVRGLKERLMQLPDASRSKARSGGSRQPPSQAALQLERLAARMRQSADQMLAASGVSGRGVPAVSTGGDPRAQAAVQQDLADELERLADRLGEIGDAQDDESRRLSERLARARELREQLDRVGSALDSAGRQTERATADASPKKAPGDRGRTGEGRRGAGGQDLTRLTEESLRQLREVGNLMEQLRRDDPSLSRNGAGFTFEGQGMVRSAPGTEAFKQDFARWEVLRRRALVALEQVESALAQKLQAKESKDRLAVGVDDRTPPEYQSQVGSYFKAIASKKR